MSLETKLREYAKSHPNVAKKIKDIEASLRPNIFWHIIHTATVRNDAPLLEGQEEAIEKGSDLTISGHIEAALFQIEKSSLGETGYLDIETAEALSQVQALIDSSTAPPEK